MTIATLAKLNKKNDGHFFDRETLKGNRERMSDFYIQSENETRIVVAHRRHRGTYKFSPKTGRVIFR